MAERAVASRTGRADRSRVRAPMGPTPLAYRIPQVAEWHAGPKPQKM